MSTIYLRFPDRAAFLAGLPADSVLIGEQYDPLPAGIEALHVCGAGTGRLVKNDAVYGAEGECLQPPTTYSGFHVNALGELPPEWEQYRVNPSNPQSRFGD